MRCFFFDEIFSTSTNAANAPRGERDNEHGVAVARTGSPVPRECLCDTPKGNLFVIKTNMYAYQSGRLMVRDSSPRRALRRVRSRLETFVILP